MRITVPQLKLLYRIQQAGTLTQNSKARTMVEALEKAGLIKVEMVPRRGCYPGYNLTALRCEHGRLLSHRPQPNPACTECEEKWWAAREAKRCPTCGRLPP
jgi:hypothetical protein